MLSERNLDLAGLDAEAADLDLMVGAAEKMQRAFGPPARTVAGAVHATARRSERIGDETFGGQARAVEVTARQTAAGDIEFARHSDRHRLQAIVQYIDPCVPDRTPNRGELAITIVVPRPRRHLNRCLGRTIEIDQSDVPGRRHFSSQVSSQRLATNENALEAMRVGRSDEFGCCCE